MFFIGRLLGLKLSRKVFSLVFSYLGPFFKSTKIINENLNTFCKKFPNIDKNEIKDEMWKNYGKTFIEYVYLSKLRNENSHVNLSGTENLTKIINEKNQ